ncbi:peroxisome biogenesis protein 7-like [Magnolia sinica]|uniref:peroxisome biogenesis protein 7-like n=1 Tax=Magnolia sinica TaxID=86752 RepID=UPI0026598620|nr:peroxisome biogenesis protein 7-like [Magnolia sinica]
MGVTCNSAPSMQTNLQWQPWTQTPSPRINQLSVVTFSSSRPANPPSPTPSPTTAPYTISDDTSQSSLTSTISFDSSQSSLINTISFHTFQGLNEFAWSKLVPNIIVAGDYHGSVIFLNLSHPPSPVQFFPSEQHSSKISTIDWNPIDTSYFLTSGSEANVKVWTLVGGNNSNISNFRDDQTIYSSIWKPNDRKNFACAGHRILGINDTRMRHFFCIARFDQYLRSCDWCKNNDNYIATASEFDGQIMIWDIRHTTYPYMVSDIELGRVIGTGSRRLQKVKFLPDLVHKIASCSEESVALWNYRVGGPPIDKYVHHVEPVFGLDMSPHINGLIPSTGLDGLVHVWKRTEAASTL